MRKQKDDLIPTRATLLNRLKNWQDNSSWQEFFDTYWKLIYGVARKAGLTDAEAQDVVQETMRSVARHMPTFQYDPAIGSFKAWLLIKTRWCITDQFRKRGPVDARSPSWSDAGAGTDTIGRIADPAGQGLDAMWEEEWEKNLLEAAIVKVKRRLDPQKYQIFDFYVTKEWPAEKVAAKFGVTVEHVYMAKHRISEMIKEEVKKLEKGVT
jgi:RNA polymerase sigma factor (sigma-70 family)